MTDGALPAVASPAAGGDDFAAAVRSAQSDLAESIARADLRNDPLRYPLAALAHTVGLFPDLLVQLRAATQEARQPIDPAAIARLEKAAAEGASRASAALVRAHNRRSILLGALFVTGATLAALGAGYWWGRSAALTRFRIAETGFSQMMHDNPEAATGWLNLAQQNDYTRTMAACHGDQAFTDASGRHACAPPLWLEAPRADAAPSAPTVTPGKALPKP